VTVGSPDRKETMDDLAPGMVPLSQRLRGRLGPLWRRLPPVSRLIGERDDAHRESAAALAESASLRRRVAELEAGQMWPPGHYYSPIGDPTWVAEHATRLATANPPSLPGIDLRVDAQLALLAELAPLVADIPFGDEPVAPFRYGFANDQYSYGDASCLYGMLRLLRPARYVEVGSGWSSALALDVNASCFDHAMSLTFIEPNPERLEARLRPEDRDAVTMYRCPVQDVDLDVFGALEAGDVCFIDSSHVSKAGSDVNFVVFEVLPRLAPGVYVHVHDIGWPFEYFEDWLRQGRNWNEAYVLRAYLAENPHYRVELWNHFLICNHPAELLAALPLSVNSNGASLWLRRM